MISVSVILSLALAPFVLGQSNNSELGIEAIEAHFTNAGIVPSLLASFDPSAVLTLSYNGVGNISPGQALTNTREFMTRLCQILMADTTLLCRGRSYS